MITGPHGILFDLGGTLLHLEEFDVQAGTQRVLSQAHNPRGLGAREVCALVEELEADLRVRRDESWLELSPFTVHRLVYEPHGVRFDRPFHEVELEFWRAATRFTPTDGVHDLLAGLRERGLSLAVVSNSTFSSETLRWQLEESGLARFLEFVMSSADYVVRKPHPVIYHVAARKLRVPSDRIWFVGDSPEYDVAGARNAGMVSVLYRPSASGQPEPASDLEVRSWVELSEHVAQAPVPS